VLLKVSLLLSLGLLAACTSPPTVTQDTNQLPLCGPFPNCVNSESGTEGQAIEPIRGDNSQWQQLNQWLVKQESWEVIVSYPSLVHAVAKTPTLGFKDDVLFRYDSDQQLIHVRSSSRIGYSDMGANRKRIEQVRLLLEMP